MTDVRSVSRQTWMVPVVLGLALLLAALLQAAAFWPGIMTWDAVRQYGEALTGHYDDWHPPAMDWLWRQLLVIHAGPAPMLVLQMGLYWAGFAGLAGWALRARRRGLAIGLTLAALMPIPLALMGAVLKDCLMAGGLMAVVALLAWLPQRGGRALRAAAIVLLVGAATLRFNALPACLPLMIAVLPPGWWSTRWRFAAATLVCAVILASALPVANRLLRAEPSGVGLSLVIFDLAGITYHSGVDVFPDIDVQDRVAVNAKCYTAVQWDHYAWWSPEACPIQFLDVGDAFDDAKESPYRHWFGAVVAHPFAYAAHRLAHFNLNMRFLTHKEVEQAAQIESAPNDWGYHIVHNPLLDALYWLALWTGRTPLGWPICWMALALGTLIVAPALPTRRIIVPVALSALLYGLGYLPASVASELRYNLWTMLAALVAAAIAAADLHRVGGVRPAQLRWASAPLIIVTTLCLIWRLT
ncbi:hypothetical protein U1839_15030 [Sphingomonas sp. RT2P30]|uniref:hypothetical protein n=1 Tax=Parasphingomonas halimpatiens TaxID=3096162 RepID=UPI002FCB2D3F